MTSATTWSPVSGFDIAFRVYVIGGGSSNSAPTIGASSPTVSANEGSVPTNTGSFSDADGDNVSLFPSVGTVTKTSGTPSNGNWLWRGVAGDEGPTSFVSIRAEDGNGGVALTTFSVTINPVAPTAWIRTAPTSANEGTSVTVSGYGTSPSAEDNAGPWTYAWSVTKNGDHYGTDGTAGTYTFPVDDDGAYVVTLVATDDGGFASLPKSVSISGHNLPPTAAITGVTTQTPLIMITQQELTFTGQFTDPGVLDTHHVNWDFGDGTSSTQDFGPGGGPTTFSATHKYTASRTYPVILTVRDKDGGQSTATWNVTIQTTAQALGKIAEYIGTRNDLNNGEKNSLQAKLNAAAASFQRGNANASCNQLNAFLNEVDAKAKTGSLNPTDLATIGAATRATQLSMGCFQDLTNFLSGL